MEPNSWVGICVREGQTFHNCTITLSDTDLTIRESNGGLLENHIIENIQFFRNEEDMIISTNYYTTSTTFTFVDSETARAFHETLRKSSGLLSDKQFLPRNSILSELFELKHIRTIYNIFIVILIILFLNTAVHDVVTTGKLNLGFKLIIWNFEKPHVMVLIWLRMMLSTIMLYIAFFYWATWRAEISPNSVTHRCLGYLGFFSLLAYELLLLLLPAYYICEYELHPGASFTLLMEQVRLMMKTHAFVRSNLHRTLAYKKNDDDVIHSPCPGFSYFLYFMFAPTLVYRDHYPRTREIRWKVVAFHFSEVGGVVFYIAFIFERFLIPMFRDFGLHPATPDNIVMVMFGAMMPATLAFLCGFYCLLHSWMNAFAEMLQFGDRMFYKDSLMNFFIPRSWDCIISKSVES